MAVAILSYASCPMPRAPCVPSRRHGRLAPKNTKKPEGKAPSRPVFNQEPVFIMSVVMPLSRSLSVFFLNSGVRIPFPPGRDSRELQLLYIKYTPAFIIRTWKIRSPGRRRSPLRIRATRRSPGIPGRGRGDSYCRLSRRLRLWLPTVPASQWTQADDDAGAPFRPCCNARARVRWHRGRTGWTRPHPRPEKDSGCPSPA